MALAFFASPSNYFGLALPIGGLYYFFLVQVFQALPQMFGFYYYPSIGDMTFSIILATTALGYFYLLSSYITYIYRRKHDFVRLVLIASVALVFISPFLILSVPPAMSTYKITSYEIIDAESCTRFPIQGTVMKWEESSKTCYLSGTAAVEGYDILGIANDITLEVQAEGNMTITHAIANNGSIVVNGILKNYGTINNAGIIEIENGIIENDGTIESVKRHSIFEIKEASSVIVNKAELHNIGYIYNYGNFTNLGSVINVGQIQFFDESVVMNRGEIGGSGRIEIAGKFDNVGRISNLGILVTYEHLEGSAAIQSGVVDNFGEIVNTFGQFHNLSLVNNYGTIENELGHIENQGMIKNRGSILNNYAGDFVNYGTIENYCNGIIEGQMEITIIDACEI